MNSKLETRNSKLKLFTGNRLERLVDRLAEELRLPLSSPLESEIIMVQSRGMERWLSMELASRLGICANVRFPFPNRFVLDLLEIIVPDFSGRAYSGPAAMAWMIMQRLPGLLEQPSFHEIRRYIEGDETGLKRYQLAEKIAALFDQYLIYRPDMMYDWERGKGDQWQAVLWRALAGDFGQAHPAAVYKALLKAVRNLKAAPPGFPARISVFGISTLPPFHIRILCAVSALTEVNLFLMNPCREYWADIVSGREMRKISGRRTGPAEPAELHLEKGNSLLASTGLLGRDFFSLLYDMGAASTLEESEYFSDPLAERDDLLAAIQSDILNLRERGSGAADYTAEPRTIDRRERSIQVHACHTPMREIEVLQDALLSMFGENPGLNPRDVLVMTPDIEKYAPFIQAVFSVPPDDPRAVPFSIADRGVRSESPYIESFLGLLDLHETRFGAGQVTALLDSPALRRRFSFSEEDSEMIRRWVREAGIRWGIDAESRREAGIPAFAGNTWKAGFERMLLGYALPPRDELFRGILPFEAAAEGDFQALGRLVDFAERLFAMTAALKDSRPLAGWADFLKQVAEEFLSPGEEAGEAPGLEGILLRRVLNGLNELQEASGFAEPVPFTPVRAYLKSALDREGFGSGFLAGGVTFCAMLPMRSIPFKVICLIGMNDEDYPRQEQSLGFDLIAQHPQPGDRSRRNDDRYLFLEALLSAREGLYISYIGQSARDNSVRPPSVLVSELMDTIEQGFRIPRGDIRDALTTRHRLQAFSSDYFKPGNGNRYFSYSRENCEAARRIQSVRTQRGAAEPRRFIPMPLPEPGQADSGTDAEKDWRAVAVEDLCRFFAHPSRFFLNRRLRIYLREEDVSLDENEPFELDGLERYQIEQWLVGKGIQGIDPKDLWPVARASGKIPPGSPGECMYAEIGAGVEDFVQKALPHAGGVPACAFEIEAQIGAFRIFGRIPNVRPAGLLYMRYAKIKAADRLRAWIYHLLVNRACICAAPRCTLICRDFEGTYAPVVDPEQILRSLLDVYWQGLSSAVPFIPEVSWTYVEAIAKGKTRDEALAAAARPWFGSDFNSRKGGEKDDPYYRICFRDSDPLGSEAFCDLAGAIFDPLCESITGPGASPAGGPE